MGEPMKEWDVGEWAWAARSGQEQVRETCPVCFGKFNVMLVLGDGSECILECDYCGKGYTGPQGSVLEYRYVVKAEKVLITQKEVRFTGEAGIAVTYHSGHWYFDDKDNKLFETEEEAKRRAEEICAEENLRQLKCMEHGKNYAKKNLSWQAGYHKRMVEDAERTAAYHRAKARFIQSRMKGGIDVG